MPDAVSSGRGRYIARIAGYVISVCCIIFLASRVEWRLFVGYVGSARPGPLLLAVVFVLATYLPFALRWRLLLSFTPRLPIRQVCLILMLGHFGNLLLPMRAGDALRVVLIRNAYGHGVTRAASSILLERLFDVAAVLAFGSVVALTATLPQTILVFLRSAAIAAAIGAVLVVVVVLRADVVATMLTRVIGPFSSRLARIAGEHVAHFADAVDTIFPRDRGSAARVAAIVGLTLAGWASFGCAMALCTAAFGVQHAIPAGLSLMVVTNLGTAIPSSPASIGVYEALGIVALSPWLADTSLALVVASVSHAVAIVVQFSLGFLAMALSGRGIYRTMTSLPRDEG